MIKKIFFLVIFLLFVVISWRAFQSHIFNFHFVDEDENIIAGYYMTKGEKLYSDIFSHKQPLPAVVSMTTQKITNPNSLYLLIKRNREFVFLYSFLWSVILILSFGLTGLIFVTTFEITKQFLLGNLLLGESLVIFPAVYLIGYLWQHEQAKLKITESNKFLFSLSVVLILLLLFALIPYAIFALLALPVFFKKWKNFIFPLCFSFLLGVLITFPFVNYQKYFENTWMVIQTHYLGATINEGLGKIITFSLLRPFVTFFASQQGDFGQYVKAISLVYLLTFIYLIVLRRNLRKILVFSFLLLGLSSLRYIDPSATFYNGFHALPWFGLILWITIWQLGQIWQDGNLRQVSIVIVTISLCFLGGFFINDYYRISDRETEWYIHYSQLRDTGRTIKKIAEPSDKILVMPVEQLIYWESGLGHATRFLYGYEWIFTNPYYKKEIVSELEKNPPAFIYYDREAMGKEAWDIFDKYVASYKRLRQEGQETLLFVRKDRFGL